MAMSWPSKVVSQRRNPGCVRKEDSAVDQRGWERSDVLNILLCPITSFSLIASWLPPSWSSPERAPDGSRDKSSGVLERRVRWSGSMIS